MLSVLIIFWKVLLSCSIYSFYSVHVHYSLSKYQATCLNVFAEGDEATLFLLKVISSNLWLAAF